MRLCALFLSYGLDQSGGRCSTLTHSCCCCCCCCFILCAPHISTFACVCPLLSYRLAPRREEKERLKKEKKARKAAEKAAMEAANKIHDVTYLSYDEQDKYEPFGDMTRVMSRSRSGRSFAKVKDLGSAHKVGDSVWLRGRLSSIRIKGGSCFLVLRQDSSETVQACYFKDKENLEQSQKMLKYLKTLTAESVIDLEGTLVEAVQEVKSCSIQNIELAITRIHSVSPASAQLPFQIEDAARSEAEVEASQETDRPFPRLGQVRSPIRATNPISFAL